MENKVINELNAFLKGEIMAVESYQRFIDAAKDERAKNELVSIQKDHRQHIDMISERIRKIGGEPEKDTGFAGIMASTKLAFENAIGRDDLELLKEAYDGEDKGVAKAEEIVKGDLDNDSRSMINSILQKDHVHLSSMAHLISEYELGR